ncbi:uncharacterized protein PHACADRAFT_259419, partial [Phanerochaete carnosa HHB-10118-sp]
MTTLASNSGTATSGQVVGVTQVTTRSYGIVSTATTVPTGNTANDRAGTANPGHGTNALVVILVPVLVVTALLVPCIFFLLRIRRRRQGHFVATYENLTVHNTSDTEYQPEDSLRPPYADTLPRRDSGNPLPYDMPSIPSASMLQLDMAQVSRARADSRLVSPLEDPFADHVDAHAPLYAEYYVHGRSDSRGSQSQTRSPSVASSTRTISRWNTLTSPVSRRGAYSPAPTDSRAGSRSGHSLLTRGHSKHHTDASVDLATPFEWDGMEDPFADPNKHGV